MSSAFQVLTKLLQGTTYTDVLSTSFLVSYKAYNVIVINEVFCVGKNVFFWLKTRF